MIKRLLDQRWWLRKEIWQKSRTFCHSSPRGNELYGETIPHFLSGETVLVTESRFKGAPHLIKLTENGESNMKSRNGKRITILHNDLIGRDDCGVVFYVKGIPFRMKRPSLEEYVLHMRRGATPSYPKDIQAILLMLDAKPGGRYLEAGSGSGALTLFLSRTVGKKGCIHSFENNPRHCSRAIENFTTWCDSLSLARRHDTWPMNVTFYQQSVVECGNVLPDAKLNGAVLDMQYPEECLEQILPVIQPQGPVVIFLPSITQVVDVIKYCTKKCLPFDVDTIVEVIHRKWKVLPVTPGSDTGTDECAVDLADGNAIDLPGVKFTAKPSFQQLPHTGFILKMINRGSTSNGS